MEKRKGKVVLVNPPDNEALVISFGTKLSPVKQFALPPLGLLSLLSYLRSKNIDSELVDAPAYELDLGETIKKVLDLEPTIVGISSNTGTYPTARKVSRGIKEENKDIIIVFGGPHPTALPEFTLTDSNADYVIRGEGEYSLEYLIKRLYSGEKVTDTPGLTYSSNGEFKSNPSRPIEDLDSLPLIDWNLIDLKKYRPSPASFKKLPALSTITSRGCPYHCIYCNKNIFGRVYRPMSVSRVMQDLESLQNIGVVDVNFWDDDFTMQRDRTIELCKEIKETGLIWNCSTRANLVDKELLEIMADSGCYEIGYGVETGTNRIMELIKKGVTLDQIRDAIKWTEEVGIETKAYFMLGFPTETKEEIEKTIDFALELNPDVASFNIVIPYPGTELFKMYEKSLPNELDYDKLTFGDLDFVASDKYPPDELRSFVRGAYKRYYIRGEYIAKKVLPKLTSYSQTKRLIMAGLSLM